MITKEKLCFFSFYSRIRINFDWTKYNTLSLEHLIISGKKVVKQAWNMKVQKKISTFIFFPYKYNSTTNVKSRLTSDANIHLISYKWILKNMFFFRKLLRACVLFHFHFETNLNSEVLTSIPNPIKKILRGMFHSITDNKRHIQQYKYCAFSNLYGFTAF